MSEIIKPKRKIGDVEELYDLEQSFSNINKKPRSDSIYTLKCVGVRLYVGKFNIKLNLNHIGEFIDIKHDVVTHIESKEFIRNNNLNKIMKRNINSSFTYLKLRISLISCEVSLQLFNNGVFLIRNCNSLSDADSAIEKLLFEIDSNKFKNLFYL